MDPLLLRLLISILVLGKFVRSAGSPPSIFEHPLDILVVKDDPATLRCGTTGEEVEINWYKDSELVRVGNGHRLLLPNGSLFLLKVNSGGTDSDAGTYHCVARNKYGEVRSQDANVRVAMLRDDFRINPHAVQALIGSRVTLECSPPKGFPEPVVTWRRDDKELDPLNDNKYHQSPDGNLIIENAQRTDAGFYQCVSTNLVGERISKPARLSVFEKPRFLVEPKNVVAEANSSILFECRVIGEPMPSISWKKRNGQMPIGRAYVARDRGGLRIENIQPNDAGDYVCFAKNPVGSIESSAQLRVNAPPIFTKLPQNLRIGQAQTAVFECEAIGQPSPGIFWSKEGDQLFTFFSGLVSSDGRIQVTKEGRLIIDDVRPIDEGNYVCAAVNSAGSTLAKASLSITNNASTRYPPPIIQYGHQNQTLMFNDMAILPCQATGRVPVEITWSKDGNALDFNTTDHRGRYRQLPVGTLQITDLRKEDTGVYICRARNEDGEATWTASLVSEEHTNQETLFHRMPDAAALPSSPGKPLMLNVTEQSIELEWTVPERHGSSPIIGYLLQYWSPELEESWRNVLDVVSQTRFRVKDLQPGHSYVFIVRAENSKGIGLPSPISDIAVTKRSTEWTDDGERSRKMSRLLDLEAARQRLSSEQLIKLLEVRALNATSILLTWKRQRNEPLVQGYYIKWRGPPRAHDNSWINVTNPEADHVIILGLNPFNNYEFFVIPYHQQIQGMPSNSLDGTTAEAPPSMSPTDIRLRMLNITSLRISWRPPPADAINGILKGFIINIKSNHSSVEDRNITTNERATSVTLYRLIPNASYAIRVAARTNAGVGVFYNGEPVVMSKETLNQHIKLYERYGTVWYRPWSVLVCGIVLWCLLLLAMILFWYRCCHQNGREGENGAKGREFIKISDGSVANVAMACDPRINSFWAPYDRFNGGTVETRSGTLARGGEQQAGYLQHLNYSSDYVGDIDRNPSGADHQFSNGVSLINRTLQRGENAIGDCQSSLHSPHYHYAHLPEHSSLSTFLQQRSNPEHYDDPSPYATTTLVTPTGTVTQTLRSGRSNKGSTVPLPTVPLKPVPKEPPRNFLSRAAVMQINQQRTSGCFEEFGGQHTSNSSNSCGALLELNNGARKQRITAAEQQKRNEKRNKQFGEERRYGTAGRPTRSGGRRSMRSSSANTTVKQAFCSLRRISHRHHQNGGGQPMTHQQQQESPQTDISYLQSSDGTSGSNNNHNINKDDAPEYDPVMSETVNQLILANINKRRGRERTSRSAPKRVSLIEDEENEEKDLLVDGDGDLEADGESSENEQNEEVYVMATNDGRKRIFERPKKTAIEADFNEHYYGFLPAPNIQGRQPMMGVNISTLSANSDRKTSSSPIPHR